MTKFYWIRIDDAWTVISVHRSYPESEPDACFLGNDRTFVPTFNPIRTLVTLRDYDGYLLDEDALYYEIRPITPPTD